MTPITAILIGAGQRGSEVFGAYALKYPDRLRFVAVAEPNSWRRTEFSQQHRIARERQFNSWELLLEKPKLADVAFICTQDQMHTAPTLAALAQGYDLLLEKPMATTMEDCRQIVEAARTFKRKMLVAHGLRYTDHFSTIKKVIQSGEIGEVIDVDHRENVSWWHMAHSYVRGNWRNTAASSPMILAKCCHDLDILIWMLNEPCRRLSSVGGLSHFRPECAPPGAPLYCVEGCPAADTCPFFAPLIYADYIPLRRNIAESAEGMLALASKWQLHSPGLVKQIGRVSPIFRSVSEYRAWPGNLVSADGERSNILEGLKTSPYGRCVYHCDNDVVDHQVVSMEFARGTSVTLSMHGFSHDEGRTTRIQGTEAEIYAEFLMAGSWVEIRRHRDGKRTRIRTTVRDSAGHGGGDERLMDQFIRLIKEDKPVEKSDLSTPLMSLESHLMAFAAEDARLEHRVVQMDDYRNLEIGETSDKGR